MSRATEQLMDVLHAMAAETIIEQINKYRAGEVIDPKSGMPETVPPALIAQAIKFLKDNGVDSPARAKKVLDTLKDSMPDFDEDFPQMGALN